MAFVKADLTRVRLNPTGDERANWVYITQEQPQIVQGAGYFPLSSEMRKYELLNVIYYRGNDRKVLRNKRLYKVTAENIATSKISITSSDVSHEYYG